MTTYWLTFRLLSDATFGRGDGVAGAVDAEVQHDEYGLPYLSGKTLKGLLGAECAEILSALEQPGRNMEDWHRAARRLFGEPGSRRAETGLMFVGDARPPQSLRAALAKDLNDRLQRAKEEVARQFNGSPAELAAAQHKEVERVRGVFQRANLESLTALRRQTAMDAVTGAPLENTLRTMRVILRDTPFESELIFSYPINVDEYERDRALLAACVCAFRRAGTGRNRGRGRLTAELRADPLAAPLAKDWFGLFRKEVPA